MNFKKIAITAAVAGTILVSAMPAFANGTRVRNWANVTNNVKTVANTGALSFHNEVEGGDISHTGDAFATGVVSNVVNTNNLDCGCFDEGGRHLRIRNGARVTNNVKTVANTGAMARGDVEGGDISHTGNADAGSMVSNVVNTNNVGL